MNAVRVGLGIALLMAAPSGWVAAAGRAEESPYTSLASRDVKALSATEIEGLLAGRGMGFALAAELNGYPGPKHVLELADELDLTEEQSRWTREIFDSMAARAIELGRQIVAAERRLDRSFAARDLDEADLGAQVEEIGRLNGRLRATHLRAHLAMTDVLSETQRQRYVTLRGYAERTDVPSHPHHDHGGAHEREGVER